MSDYKVLKLNKHYFPIGVERWERVVTGMFAGRDNPEGSFIPARITLNEENEVDNIETFPNIEDWKKLTPRKGENFVRAAHQDFVIPNVVICSKYKKIPFRRAIFPTKANIWERDDYTCGYTGKKLSKSELSIDHIIPSSKGGENTWENLITCDRQLNSWKSDKSLEECDLELLWKPTRPKNGLVFDVFDDAWKAFI